MRTISEYLSDSSAILPTDGAKGTEFFSLVGSDPSEFLNETSPDAVRKVTKAYRDAGAIAVQTNSFNGTEPRLKRHNPDIDSEKVYQLNLAAARIAREVVGNQGYVLGSMGPTGEILDEFGGDYPRKDAVKAFATQAKALITGGSDAINPETFISLGELEAAIEGIRSVSPDIPIIATLSFTNYKDTRGFNTEFGDSPVDLITFADQRGLLAHGANCGIGLKNVERLMQQFKSKRPASVLMTKLNAGMPELRGTQVIYPEATSEQILLYTDTVRNAGARIIGLCCGSNPKLIKVMTDRLTQPL